MISRQLADKLTTIALKQLDAGIRMKEQRMKLIKEIEDLYNNKVVQISDGRVNIPFPIMSGQIDTIYSKIDNPPSVKFEIPNREDIAARVSEAWKIDSSSRRAGWKRKDRAEKKLALFSGRGISKIYATSIDKNYQAHYDVVDHRSFVCEGTRGNLEDNLYCGEIDIFKTEADIAQMVRMGIYDRQNATALVSGGSEEKQAYVAFENQWDRMRALGLSPEMNAFVGQKIFNMAEWYIEYSGTRYYLLLDPRKGTWLRAEKLSDITGSKNPVYPYTSWATNYDEFNFWSKGPGDDILPIAEAMRLILNETLENARRRNRPMRMVDNNVVEDINQLLEYVPDNVIIAKPGRTSNIVTLETPEISTSINLVQFLNHFMGEKTGISSQLQGTPDQDVKVGVYYGTLQQAADRIGSINKEYSESYADKAYRYFWGLKEHLSGPKAIQMLGKFGYAWEELTPKDLRDIDDIDDVVVSGGSSEETVDEVKKKRQLDTLAQLTANPNLAAKLNPTWVIKTSLSGSDFSDDDIQEALDSQGSENRELMLEADHAIQQIIEGKQPKLNRGATIGFVERILNWDRDNVDYINPDGTVNKKQYELSQRLTTYAKAHISEPFNIVQQNMLRDVRNLVLSEVKQKAGQQGSAGPGGGVVVPPPTQQEMQQEVTQPFESGGTPEATAQTSQALSQDLSV